MEKDLERMAETQSRLNLTYLLKCPISEAVHARTEFDSSACTCRALWKPC